MWASLPRIHGALPPTMTSAIVWGAVLMSSLAPLPRYTAEAISTAERATQRESESKAQAAAEDRKRRENLARFEKLTAGSPLWEWAEFIGQGSELDKQAVAGAQKLSHRQADAEVALDRGMGFFRLWNTRGSISTSRQAYVRRQTASCAKTRLHIHHPMSMLMRPMLCCICISVRISILSNG